VLCKGKALGKELGKVVVPALGKAPGKAVVLHKALGKAQGKGKLAHLALWKCWHAYPEATYGKPKMPP